MDTDKISGIFFSPISLKELETLIENCVRRAIGNPVDDSGDIIDIDEAAAFLGLQRPTLYTKVSKRQIPFMKQGKRLYFSKTDLTEWIKSTARKVKNIRHD